MKNLLISFLVTHILSTLPGWNIQETEVFITFVLFLWASVTAIEYQFRYSLKKHMDK